MSNITELEVSNWDMSKVTTLRGMFANCVNLTTLGETSLRDWDVSNVTTMYAMFNASHSITKIDVSQWDTSSLTDAYKIFYECRTLEEIDISNWDMSNVTRSTKMFLGCRNLEELIIPASLKIIDMGFAYDCTGLKTIKFMHSATDALQIAPAGLLSEATDAYNIECGPFYHSWGHSISTTIEAANSVVVEHDWAADKRNVSWPVTEYVLDGTWQFNETIDITFWPDCTKLPLEFVVTNEPGEAVKEMVIYHEDDGVLTYTYDTAGDEYYDVYYAGGWLDDDYYRTITLTHPQTVSEEFYTWFVANASPLEINLITFAIQPSIGNPAVLTFVAEEGMTWEEWVNSDYAPPAGFVHSVFINNVDYVYLLKEGGLYANVHINDHSTRAECASDIIIEGNTYLTYTSNGPYGEGHIGGAL
jgi:surface protein